MHYGIHYFLRGFSILVQLHIMPHETTWIDGTSLLFATVCQIYASVTCYTAPNMYIKESNAVRHGSRKAMIVLYVLFTAYVLFTRFTCYTT